MRDIIMIAAMDSKNGIGKDGSIPWHLPNDLAWFQYWTSGHSVVMGWNTFESIREKPLANRTNYVLTSKNMQNIYCDDYDLTFIKSIDELYGVYDKDRYNLSTLFIAGGASIYNQFMPLATELYITSIDGDFKCDTFFPEIDPQQWKMNDVRAGKRDEKNLYNHVFKFYKRIDQLC